jgi:hypothetical protein
MSKRNFTLYYIIPITILLILAGLAFALSPPPVNQNMGIYDTIFSNLVESNCRGCHSSGVPDTHHNLVAQGKYGCQDCHPVLNGSGVTLIRDCIQCHDTTFNGMKIRRPHHETQAAMDGHCQTCHGNLVDNFDDGHYIPASPPSSMTPDTKFKVINQTSGRKWGGCESCHEANSTASPPIVFNNNTHHRLGNLSGFRNNDNTKCARCHDMHNATYGPDSIRYCERCHGYSSLHNIQWDMANTTTMSGYGHLGPNDCQGCHASYVAGYVAGSLAPGADLIVPTINHLSPDLVFSGEATELTIHGDDFITTVDNITRSSVVALTNGIITNGTTKINLTITPTNITASEIVVTIPPMNTGLYAIYIIKDGNQESNKRPFVVGPAVIVNSAIINSTIISITGSGFGPYDPAYNDWTNVTINSGTTFRSVQVINWSETSINVTSPDATIGDAATVNSMYGSNSTQVTGG